MFGHKQKARDETEEQVKMIDLKLLPDDGSFSGDGAEIEVRGFEVSTLDGQVLYLSDTGPVIEGLFYFRLAGATHHKDVNQLDGDLGQQIFVMQEPKNPQDPDAIQVFHQGNLVGYVPAKLAPTMLPHLIPTKVLDGHNRGSMGMIVKTFHKRGRVVGAELLVVAHGYGITATN